MADDYTKMMQEMSTAHDKTREQEEALKEERKAATEPAPRRHNRNVADQAEHGQSTRNYNGGGRGSRGQSSRGYATARDGGYSREDGAGRRGGSYNPRGRGGRAWNNEEAGEDSYQIRTRGTRGVGARGAGARGSRGGPRGGPRGGNRGNGYEPRGRGGARGRGGRQDYSESQEVEYQSNPEESDGDVSSEQEALTQDELNYLERKYAECKDQLKNIVNETQIKQKCIDLEFNEDDFDRWVASLGTTDSRVAGVKEFEWNDTVTKGEKLYDRKRKLQEGKRQKLNEKLQAERATARAAALEKKKEADAKRKEERAKAQATKLVQQEAREAQERAEREARGETEPASEVLPATTQDADSGDKEEAPTKSRKNKGAAKEMVYQKKNRNEEDASFKVKNGSKTNVYRKKEPTEQPVETPEEVAAEQFEGEKKLDDYDDEGKEYYNEDDAYANDQAEQDHAKAAQYQKNQETRRQSDDESSDLLRQAAEHNQKDEQLQHEERQKAEQEKLKREKEQAERRRKEEAAKRQQAHEQANKAREERTRREAEEKAAAEKREQEAREREEKEKAAEEARRAQAQKKAAEAASEQAQQAVPNPFAHHPYMMPMALGTPAAGAQTGDKADSATQQQQMLPLDQQQYYYQAMAAHQQMAHQYQAMLTHQFALQQQLLSQGSGGNSNTKASQGPATNNGAAGLQNPLAGQNPYAAMAGMPAGFPMMPPMAAGMPGMLPPGAVGDPSQNPMLQQQFMPMPGFVPMPMMYPNQQVPHPQQPGFQSKNAEK